MTPLTLYIFPALCLLITGGVVGFIAGRMSVPQDDPAPEDVRIPPGVYHVEPYDEPATVEAAALDYWEVEWGEGEG